VNLKEALPLELQLERLRLLKEVKAIDDEFQRRLRPIITSLEDHKARVVHYSSIGKRPY